MKTVIVTGASKGIGRETALKFANNNFKVIAIARDIDLLEKNFKNYENVFIHQVDITNMNELNSFIEKISHEKIFALINNAGGGGGPHPQHWEYTYRLNVIAPMHIINELIDNFDEESIIFNVTSVIAYDYEEHVDSNYVVAKAAEAMLSKILNRKIKHLGIRFCEIVPGSVRSDTQPKVSALNSEDVAESIFWVANLKKHINIDLLRTSVSEKPKYKINNFYI